MAKYTLDDTWRLCMSMYRWVARQKQKGDKRSVGELKEAWLDAHGFADEELWENCFFCEYAVVTCGGSCEKCPGVLVDDDFHCNTEEYDYEKEPVKFFNKLTSLNRKRLKCNSVIAESKQ